MKICGFYGRNSEAPTQACKSRMKRRRKTRRFQAISALNSDCFFYVIIHSNGWLFDFFLHRLKEKWFLFQMICCFVLSFEHKCLFDIGENGQFSTPRIFLKRFLHPLVFGSRCGKLGGGKQTISRGYLSNWTAFLVCKNYCHCLRTVTVLKVLRSVKELLPRSILERERITTEF